MNDVYLRAAELIDADKEELSCGAIARLFHEWDWTPSHSVRRNYENLFAPIENVSSSIAWGEDWGDERKQCRVLALLFMHWISKEPQ